MKKQDETKGVIQAGTIRRIFTYTKPYRTRLYIGIFAGLLMASSLFGSFLFMFDVFDNVLPATQSQAAVVLKRISDIQDDKALTPQVRNQKLAELIQIREQKDPFAKKFNSAKKFCEKWDIPFPVTYNAETNTLDAFEGKIVFQTEKNGQIAWQLFAISIIGLIVMFCLKSLFTFLNKYYVRWVGNRVIEQMRNDIFVKLSSQSLEYYGSSDIGVMISRCIADVNAIEQTIRLVAADAIRCPFEILACLAGITYASVLSENYMLPLILFIGGPLCVIPMLILGKRVKRIFRTTLQRIGEVTSRMHEVFTGILMVKACHTEQKEYKRFAKVNHEYVGTLLRALRYELMMSPLTEAVTVTATMIFLIYAYATGISLASLAALMAPALLAYQPVKQISQLYSNLQRSMAAADRYFELMDTDMSLPTPKNPVVLSEFKNEIRFTDVSFSYNGNDRKILSDINFTIPKGHVVAVVGETGSGKTTIANLIARFYDVTSGAVTIDDVDVRDIDTAQLRKLIGLVTQTPILFNETIADNIAYGMENATREEIIHAAKQANAHQFIVDGRHPLGYDTIVGEKGAILSGGEKQRIAIARAILRNSPILILDEATSALDTITEKLVQDAINHAMESRTVFAIAHRLSTIQHADAIMVIDQGKIIEIGTHETLYNLNGRYRNLCNIQFAGSAT